MNFNYSIFLFYRRVLAFIRVPVLLLGIDFCLRGDIVLIEWGLLSIRGCDLVLPLILDSYGLIFRFVVIFISSNVINFANYYIEGEVYIKRFVHLVILFVVSINFLIYIPHMIGLLLG